MNAHIIIRISIRKGKKNHTRVINTHIRAPIQTHPNKYIWYAVTNSKTPTFTLQTLFFGLKKNICSKQ